MCRKIRMTNASDRHQVAMALVFVRSDPRIRPRDRTYQLAATANVFLNWYLEAYDAGLKDAAMQMKRCELAIRAVDIIGYRPTLTANRKEDTHNTTIHDVVRDMVKDE